MNSNLCLECRRQWRPSLSAYFTVEFSGCLGVRSAWTGGGWAHSPGVAPILTTNIEQVRLPIQTVWGPISSCRVLSLPQSGDFPVSFMDEIVFNAELKSTNVTTPLLFKSSFLWSGWQFVHSQTLANARKHWLTLETLASKCLQC